MQLRGKYAAVTGGTAGIGLAIARGLSAAGATVLIVGRNKTRLSELTHNGFRTLGADISQPEERERVLAHIGASGQPLDIFVNNAGTMTAFNLAGRDAQARMKQELNLNLHAPVHFCLELLPKLLRRPEAALVNVTTGLVYAPMFNSPAYCAAKNGLHAFTQSLRFQAQGTSLRVLEVLPPLVETDMVKHVKGSKARPESVANALVKGLQGDAAELRVGQTKALYFMSRLMPGVASNLINKGQETPPAKA